MDSPTKTSPFFVEEIRSLLVRIPLSSESKGFFRGCRLYRLASLVGTSAKTVHWTVFFRNFVAPSLFESLVHTKKIKNTTRVFFVFWRRARDSNPRTGYSPLHDFQSCSFGQLGQLSVFCLIIIQYKNINCKSKYYVL